MAYVQNIDRPGMDRRLMQQIADYDRVMWGEDLNEDEQKSLRTLAHVFDIDGDGVSLAKLWSRLRPLVATEMAYGDTTRYPVDPLWRNA